MAKTKKCENCGTLNELGSAYCEKCGTSLYQNTKQTTKNTINKINCPFCGQKIPMNSEQCNYCGEWIDPSAAPNTEMIILGYVSIFITFILSSFFVSAAHGPNNVFFSFAIPFIFPLIIILYLITRKNPKLKKHGVILLIIWIILIIYFCGVYQAEVDRIEEIRRDSPFYW